MKLKNASRYFDTCPVYDGYSGTLLFRVQASTFMEAASEGSVSVRRTVSLAPELVVPAHSVVMLLGETYVLGEVNSDEWSGDAIRKTCWTRKVSDYFRVTTPNETLTSAPGFSLYGQKRQGRETTLLDSSRMETHWEVSLSVSASVVAGSILKSGTTYYRVRNTYIDTDGFLTCTADQLQYEPVTVSVDTGKVYNPVTDTYTGTSTSVQGLPMDYKIAFNKQTQADFAVESGDICLLLPAGTAPSTGLTLSIAMGELAGAWRVLNVVKELDAWNVHVRRT